MTTDPATALTLETLAARLNDLEQTNAALRDELAALRGNQIAASKPIGGCSTRQRSTRTSRRKLLQLGGAAAAAGVATVALGTHEQAKAATFDNFVLGTLNDAGATTALFPSTSTTPSSLLLLDNAGTAGGFGSTSVGGTGGIGVYGEADGAGSSGMSGFSDVGYGVVGDSTTGIAVWAKGLGRILQQPQGQSGPPSGGHFQGESIRDTNGELWLCLAGDGKANGTWVRVAHLAPGVSSGGALNFLSTPIRLLDTRVGFAAATTPGAKIQPGSANTFHLPVAGVSYAGVIIPLAAKALVGNCTVVNPTGVGDLAVYPDLLPLPNTAVLHYLPGQIVSNGITIGLGTNGKLAITALGSATDVIIDCQGFIA